MSEIRMFVEIAKGSQIKYELDKETGLLVADRLTPIRYPASYGFINCTLADDNDPLDVFLLGNDVPVPGTVLNLKVDGMIEFIDNGEKDHKILAKFEQDYVRMSQIGDVVEFLQDYKPQIETKVGDLLDREKALEYIQYCRRKYEETHL